MIRILLLKRRKRKEVKEDPNLMAYGKSQCLVAYGKSQCFVAFVRSHCLVAFERFHCSIAFERFQCLVAFEMFQCLVANGKKRRKIILTSSHFPPTNST
jgi:hypothetical protein